MVGTQGTSQSKFIPQENAVIRPISPEQLLANRLNARKSTGPRTEEGKSNARFNARRHGLTGQFYCMSEADEQAYQTFETNLLTDLKPVGYYETQIAISITQDHWRLNRSRATEFNLYARGHDQRADSTDAPTANMHAASTMADTCRDENRVFANIALYETRIHRMIAKNRNELKELQAERKAAQAKAREAAESLLRFDNFIDEHAPATQTDAPTGAPPETAIEIDGFVFSRVEILAGIQHARRLKGARECAMYDWDPEAIDTDRLADFRKVA